MNSISTSSTAPEHPPVEISDYPKLDHKQAGHLRHYHNLVSQPDGEWYHFGSLEGEQEFDDSYRYQLATMAYATAVAHYHRLPAMRGPLKKMFRRMIHKMLLRQVWGYCEYPSKPVSRCPEFWFSRYRFQSLTTTQGSPRAIAEMFSTPT